MKRIFLMLPAVALLAASCQKDDTTSSGGKPVTITAEAVADFTWPEGAKIGVFCERAGIANAPFTVSEIDSYGNAVTEGHVASTGAGDYDFYAYYPYKVGNEGYPTEIGFLLQRTQSTENNVENNTFMIGTPVSANSASGVSIEFTPVCSKINFTIDIPIDGQSTTVNSIVLKCTDQPFYLYASGDITTGLVTLPATRGAYAAASTMTLNVFEAENAAPGTTAFDGAMVVMPDDYTGQTVDITVVTDHGNYAATVTLGSFAAGATAQISYTLDQDDWYDPDAPIITSKPLYVISPLNAPVSVDLAPIVDRSLTPSTIVLTPTAGGDAVTYTVLPADITARKATIPGVTKMANKPLPGTEYKVDVKNASNAIISTTTVTTGALSSNIQVITTADDLKTVLMNASRKDSVFMMPGTYNMSAVPYITAPLYLFGDDPATTKITSALNMAPKGTALTKLSFEGFTWKGSTANFMRPVANATEGNFDITDLKIKNCVFDFIGATSYTACLFYPQANATGYKGRVKYFNIEDILFIGSGSANGGVQAVINVVGGDSLLSVHAITIKNSTFSNMHRGLITLPAGTSTTGDLQIRRNDNIVPVVTLENNTFYNLCCDAGFVSSSAVIHTGSGANSMDVITKLKNNIFVFAGPSTFYGMVNCTGNAQTASVPYFENNWGLTSQPFLIRGGAGSTIPGYDNQFNGTAAQLFQAPMDDPRATGASFKVVGAGVSSTAGDPRWK